MKRKYIISIGLFAIILLIAYKLTANKKTINENNKPEKEVAVKIPVKYAAAKEQLLEVSLIKTGNLAPFKESKVITTTSAFCKTCALSSVTRCVRDRFWLSWITGQLSSIFKKQRVILPN
ncbi:hypothetical protein [Dyadobacter frigoris]|uniref:hypothetical protein n=1 Tax=Dyadobacter frigoris TaxID=2576211 RepID=UPI001C706572|nr:hypothetical protein [Dyadobacter frigoris]